MKTIMLLKLSISIVTVLIISVDICNAFSHRGNNEAPETNRVALLFESVDSDIKKLSKYIFSVYGLKDVVLAYILGKGLATMHKLGPHVLAKLFYNTVTIQESAQGLKCDSHHPLKSVCILLGAGIVNKII